VKVRQAMMAAVDRQALIDGALSGFGTLGKDIAGKGLPFFADGLPNKKQDIAKAKKLLAAAGKPSVNVTLTTSPVFPGFVESATLLAQQVKEAGFNVKIKQVQPAQYLVPPPGGLYLTMQMGQDKWPMTSLQSYYTQALVKGAIYAETHWIDPAADALLQKAIAATNPAKQTALWKQVQKIQYDRGGNLIFAQPDNLDALSKKVAGMKPGGPFELGGFSFWDAYFAG
jgi:peptide/nickel transport system substrate-binding protein